MALICHIALGDDDIDCAFKDIPTHEHIHSPKYVPPLASVSHATQPSFKINGDILDAIHSLSNDVQELVEEVRSHKDEVNSRLSTLETQISSLLITFFRHLPSYLTIMTRVDF
ncbi:hypothetical protein PVK06_043105 [Gossypium arboreum]|uniref:Uncharacterized protein n=1 Tax=Gossypium arboreum TaxID=29729 RepID=A0ABR0MN33_GOSAR|nr:hypothetical protein PVK06_043105 [Gossypium arboreum]